MKIFFSVSIPKFVKVLIILHWKLFILNFLALYLRTYEKRIQTWKSLFKIKIVILWAIHMSNFKNLKDNIHITIKNEQPMWWIFHFFTVFCFITIDKNYKNVCIFFVVYSLKILLSKCFQKSKIIFLLLFQSMAESNDEFNNIERAQFSND